MKTWLITGCSGGIGEGIANAVLQKGDRAVVTARDAGKLDKFVEKYPDTAYALPLDVTDRKSIKEAVEKAQEKFGNIDVLINNAGYGYRAAVEEGDFDEVYVQFNTNFFGPVELIKAVLPGMRKNKSGAIVNISSMAAVKAAVGSGYYAATKAALELMSDALYKEVQPLGIKVMMVEPGGFRTHFHDTSLRGPVLKIDDYNETSGKRRVENVNNKANQKGDPVKGGRVIVETIEKDDCPKRLVLGSDSLRSTRNELAERLEEMDKWEKVTVSTDYDE